MYGKMTQALKDCIVEDVRSMLEEGFAMEEYLSDDRLVELYDSVSVVNNFIFSLQLQLTIDCFLLFNILVFHSSRGRTPDCQSR